MLSPAEKQALANIQQSLQASIADIDALPVAVDNFHITLSFMGKTSEKQLESILDNFTQLDQLPFSVNLAELIYWPKAKIIAASIDDPQNNLLNCKKLIERQLSAQGIFCYSKQPFIPHLTLFKKVVTPPQKNQFFTLEIAARQISLMRSENKTTPLIYQTIESWQLRQASVKQQLLGK